MMRDKMRMMAVASKWTIWSQLVSREEVVLLLRRLRDSCKMTIKTQPQRSKKHQAQKSK